MNLRIVGLSCSVLLGACTTNQEKVYYTQKNSAITVHHVSGKVDHAETLTKEKLTEESLSKYQLSDKDKYFTVKQHTDVFVPSLNHDSPKNPTPKDTSKDKLAQVTSELHDLKRQVSGLKEQLNTKEESHAEVKSETVQQDPTADEPRLSQ